MVWPPPPASAWGLKSQFPSPDAIFSLVHFGGTLNYLRWRKGALFHAHKHIPLPAASSSCLCLKDSCGLGEVSSAPCRSLAGPSPQSPLPAWTLPPQHPLLHPFRASSLRSPRPSLPQEEAIMACATSSDPGQPSPPWPPPPPDRACPPPPPPAATGSP